MILQTNVIDIIKNRIDTCDIVSFDIFDTLLLRAFIGAEDVFLYIETFYIKDFRKIRKKALKKAIKKHKNKEEVSLTDIYNEMPLKYKDYENLEKQLEYQILNPNPEMLEVYNYAKERNKKIIIASDMYLEKDFLKQALEKKGFSGFHKLYVSSDIGYRKSTKNLFEYICKDMNVIPDKILHIGDNYQSDYRIPLSMGLNAYNYLTPQKVFWNTFPNLINIYNKNKNAVVSLVMGSFFMHWLKNPTEIESNYWQYIGYLLGGIFAYGYTKFIYECIKNKNFSDILFIARDGFVLSKIFDMISTVNIKNHYVYAPRTVKILGFAEGLDNTDYLNIFIENNPEIKKLCNTEKLNIKAKLKLINENLQLLENNIKKEKLEYEKYLSNIELNGNNLCTVDLGSNSATGQRLLTKFLGEKIKLGFYLGINHKNKIPFIEYNKNKNTEMILDFLLEMLISSPENPIKGFKEGKVVYYEDNEYYIKNSKIYEQIMQGELDFANDILKYTKDLNFSPDIDTINEYFNSFCLNFDSYDIAKFKDYTYYLDIKHQQPQSMSDFIIDRLKTTKRKERKRKNILKNIFSLEKIDNHRILTIFWIKIKFK